MSKAMVNNKQVNFWRGDEEPPTIYHIWIRDNKEMLLFNGESWEVFLNNSDTIQTITNILHRLESLESNTVNGKYIKDNPILYGEDITSKQSGQYISENMTLSEICKTFDKLLTTQVIE